MAKHSFLWQKITGKEGEYSWVCEAFPTWVIPGLAVEVFFLFLTKNKYELTVLAIVAASTFYFFSAARKFSEEEREVNNDVTKRTFKFYLAALYVVLLPLFVTSVTEQLLGRPMYWAQVRIEGGILHVKYPYSSFFPENLKNNTIAAQDFTTFEGLTVLFQGIGNNVVVEFKDGEYSYQLRIPNDSIVIEKRASLFRGDSQ